MRAEWSSSFRHLLPSQSPRESVLANNRRRHRRLRRRILLRQPTLMKRLLPVAKEMHRVITGESEKLVVPEPAVMQLLRDVEADREYWAHKLINLQEPTPPPSPSEKF